MLLFNYSRKVKIILATLLGLVIFSVVGFVIFDNSRVKDLEAVEQAKIFATALEKYYDKYNAYPVNKEIDINSINTLTENGFNQVGEVSYYQRNKNFSRVVFFVASDNNYTIKIQLKNAWKVWGLNSWQGGECRLTNYLDFKCL